PGVTERIERQAAVHGASPVVVRILVDPPTDSSLLQYIGYGWPFETVKAIRITRGGFRTGNPASDIAWLRVCIGTIDTRSTLFRIKVRAGPKNNSIRVRTGCNGAVVCIGDRKSFRQGILKRYFLASIIGHRVGCFK